MKLVFFLVPKPSVGKRGLNKELVFDFFSLNFVFFRGLMISRQPAQLSPNRAWVRDFSSR